MKNFPRFLLISVLVLATASAGTAQHGAPNGEWVSYHG